MQTAQPHSFAQCLDRVFRMSRLQSAWTIFSAPPLSEQTVVFGDLPALRGKERVRPSWKSVPVGPSAGSSSFVRDPFPDAPVVIRGESP